MTLSLLVPQEALPKVYKRLDKLARSAGVLCEEIPGTTTLIEGSRVLTCARLTIGDLPSVNGYEFAARIEHTKDGNIVVRGPQETRDLDESWRTAEPLCSHCGKKRSRKETFLLRQYGVALMQIGRNCLADFLMTDPSRMVALAELVKAIREESDDEHWGGYGGYWEVAPVAFIACAVATTERDGFVSTKSEFKTPTRAIATFLSNPCKSAELLAAWIAGQPNEDHIETAHAVIAWAANPPSGASEYHWNLSLAVKQPGIGKHAGLLASAPAAYNRFLGKQVEKKLAPARPEGFAVEKGEVFKGEVTLIRHYLHHDEKYDTCKAICTFRTDAGHELTWFASGIAPKPDMQGMRFVIKGRCKKHETYKGINKAVLSRVTWKPIEIKEEKQSA
jgi:hypothetical protein